jgi:hypothetical protein
MGVDHAAEPRHVWTELVENFVRYGTPSSDGVRLFWINSDGQGAAQWVRDANTPDYFRCDDPEDCPEITEEDASWTEMDIQEELERNKDWFFSIVEEGRDSLGIREFMAAMIERQQERRGPACRGGKPG